MQIKLNITINYKTIVQTFTMGFIFIFGDKRKGHNIIWYTIINSRSYLSAIAPEKGAIWGNFGKKKPQKQPIIAIFEVPR